MDYIVFFLFLIVALAGLFSNILGFPGNFVILADSLFYGWSSDFQEIYFKVLVLVFILAILGEVLGFVVGIAGSKKHRYSSKAIIGSIIGGIEFRCSFFLGSRSYIGGIYGRILGSIYC